MNKKGFTVVELMTTFVLVAIISTLLIKLVVTLKEVYITGDMKTTLITKQSTMTDKIYKDLQENKLTKIEACGESNCVKFVYGNISKKFVINKTNKTVTYDNYTIKLGKEGYIGEVSLDKFNSDIGSIINFKVPIHNRLVKGDYGINITYQLDDDIVFDDDITFDVSNKGIVVTLDDNINLLYGLVDASEVANARMKYTISDGIIIGTSIVDDGSIYTTGRVELEANKTYVFNCNSDGTWGGGTTDTVEVYFMLNGSTSTAYYRMTSNVNYEFTPTISGTYWLRTDINQANKTHRFWNISVKEKKKHQTKQVTLNEKYGNFYTPSREEYKFKGWSLVPSEYQQVEYIESTGTQYINTNYKPKPNTGVETTFKFNDLTTQQRVYGVNANTTVNYLNYQLYINGSTKLGYAFIDGVGNWINTEVDIDTNIHKWQFNVKDNKWKVDNISGNIADSARTKNSRYNIFLFAYSTVSNNPTNYAKARIYSFKIYEDGKVVRNYIPVYRKSDNVIGLYEIIEGKFYTNDGTGTFNKGPNGSINDEGIIDNYTVVTQNQSHTVTAIWQKEYAITNLVKNGSFENGINNWIKRYYIDESAQYHTSNTTYKKFGSKSIERAATDTNAKNLLSQSIHFTEGHKYYYFLYGATASTSSQRIGSDINSRANSSINVYVTDKHNWAKADIIYPSSSTEDREISVNYAVTTAPTFVDGVGVVDLTETFGTGKEPTLEWCHENINYFDGTKKILK